MWSDIRDIKFVSKYKQRICTCTAVFEQVIYFLIKNRITLFTDMQKNPSSLARLAEIFFANGGNVF